MDERPPGIIIGECRGTDPLSRMIEYRGGFSHSTTLLPGGRFVLDSRYQGGVAIRRIAYLAHDHVEWLYLPCSYTQELAYYAALHSQLGKPYDRLGIKAFVDGSLKDRNFRDTSAWFCDEIIVWALEKCGRIPMLILPPFKIDPGGLGLVLSTAGATRIRLTLKGGALTEF